MWHVIRRYFSAGELIIDYDLFISCFYTLSQNLTKNAHKQKVEIRLNLEWIWLTNAYSFYIFLEVLIPPKRSDMFHNIPDYKRNIYYKYLIKRWNKNKMTSSQLSISKQHWSDVLSWARGVHEKNRELYLHEKVTLCYLCSTKSKLRRRRLSKGLSLFK